MKQFDPVEFLRTAGRAPAPPPAAAASPSPAFDPAAFLARARGGSGAPAAVNPVAGADYDPTRPRLPEVEEPGLLASVGRGAIQGATFGFADEITGALESAFTPKTYTTARNESRSAYKAAQEAHPIGYGLGEVLGGVSTGLATGGLAGGAAKLGAKGVAALAAGEGALASVGGSEAETAGGLAKDAAIGGAVGGVLGGGLAKVLGRYAGSAPERHARHVVEDLTDGASKTIKKRLAGKAGDDVFIANVVDRHPDLAKKLDDPEEALSLIEGKVKTLATQTRPKYAEIDKVHRPMSVGDVNKLLNAEYQKAAGEAGNEAYRDLVWSTMKNFNDAYGRGARNMSKIPVPTAELRAWTTRLKKQADRTLGALAETERLQLKQQIHEVAHGILTTRLDDAAKAAPRAAELVSELRPINQELSAFSRIEDALEARALNERVGQKSLVDKLKTAGLPGVAALAAGGGTLLASGGAALGAVAAQKGGKALNRAATSKLAEIVKAARSGNVEKARLVEAVKAGVPVATVMGILGTMRAVPDWARELPGELASAAADAL